MIVKALTPSSHINYSIQINLNTMKTQQDTLIYSLLTAIPLNL